MFELDLRIHELQGAGDVHAVDRLEAFRERLGIVARHRSHGIALSA